MSSYSQSYEKAKTYCLHVPCRKPPVHFFTTFWCKGLQGFCYFLSSVFSSQLNWTVLPTTLLNHSQQRWICSKMINYKCQDLCFHQPLSRPWEGPCNIFTRSCVFVLFLEKKEKLTAIGRDICFPALIALVLSGQNYHYFWARPLCEPLNVFLLLWCLFLIIHIKKNKIFLK